MSLVSNIDRWFRGSLLTIGVAASCACGLFGPSESVEGLWQGDGGLIGTVYLNLHQDGDLITGWACGSVYHSAAVLSKYPYVKFSSWEGKLERSGAIVSTKISSVPKFTRIDGLPQGCS
jgi:hypothetical protein